MTEQDNEITDFRATHEAALFNSSHPEHSERVKDLFALTAKHYGSVAISDRGFIRSPAVEKLPQERASASTVAVNQPLAGEAASALKAEIAAFRTTHGTALYESGHSEHERRVKELTELTSRLHGDTSANDPINGFNTKKAAVMEDAMKPLKAEEFKIGRLDDFAKALPPYEEWDGELEADTRTWMANGEMNEGEARGLMAAFSDGYQHDFSPEYSERNHDAAHSYLVDRYGDHKDEAIVACNRVIAEIGGAKLQRLKDVLRETGLGNHPGVVFQISQIAERKGYIKRKSAQP